MLPPLVVSDPGLTGVRPPETLKANVSPNPSSVDFFMVRVPVIFSLSKIHSTLTFGSTVTVTLSFGRSSMNVTGTPVSLT